MLLNETQRKVKVCIEKGAMNRNRRSSPCRAKIAMRLLDAVHFRCLNARGTLFTVQKALPLFNVFVDFTNRFVRYRSR